MLIPRRNHCCLLLTFVVGMQVPRLPAALSLTTMVNSFSDGSTRLQMQGFLAMCRGMSPFCHPATSADRKTAECPEKEPA